MAECPSACGAVVDDAQRQRGGRSAGRPSIRGQAARARSNRTRPSASTTWTRKLIALAEWSSLIQYGLQ